MCIYLNKARKYIKTKQIKEDSGMNRIYKIIWSKMKNCYVVVSEFAKRNSKSTVNSGFSVTRNILAGAVVLGLTAGVCAPVWAEETATQPFSIIDANGKVLFHVGVGSTTYTGVDNSGNTIDVTAVGPVVYWGNPLKEQGTNKVMVEGAYATAWGESTVARGMDATAFGSGTRAIGGGATAFGRNTKAAQMVLDSNGYVETLSNKFVTLDGYLAYQKDGKTFKVFKDNNNNSQKLDVLDDGNGHAFVRDTDKKCYAVIINDDGTATIDYNSPVNYQRQTYTVGDEKVVTNDFINATAFGQGTLASNDEATAFGFMTKATGKYSTAWGNAATASNVAATAWGQQTVASGEYSTASGGKVQLQVVRGQLLGVTVRQHRPCKRRHGVREPLQARRKRLPGEMLPKRWAMNLQPGVIRTLRISNTVQPLDIIRMPTALNQRPGVKVQKPVQKTAKATIQQHSD